MPFAEAVRGLMKGDFSRLEPLFHDITDGSPSQIVQWHQAGCFQSEPEALKEAFTCACFNGCLAAAEYLLATGVDPNGGIATGMNAFHWAANRGQLSVVQLLLKHNASLETRNHYGGTVLGGTAWAAVHEPKPAHLEIVHALLAAGANIREAEFPSGDARLDQLLRRHGATA